MNMSNSEARKRKAPPTAPPPRYDRDEIKAVIVGAGDAPAEIADAVVAYLARVEGV